MGTLRFLPKGLHWRQNYHVVDRIYSAAAAARPEARCRGGRVTRRAHGRGWQARCRRLPGPTVHRLDPNLAPTEGLEE